MCARFHSSAHTNLPSLKKEYLCLEVFNHMSNGYTFKMNYKCTVF